jgi:cation diffusion facilitator family transporter
MPIALPKVLRIAAGSIGIGLIVLALKGAAWWVTGSAALYSDALETVVNVAASVIAWQALRVAGRPADREHPYGHAKAEFLAAALEGALIVAAAVSILQAAWHSWQHPHALETPWLGLALNAFATLINFAWAQVLLRVAARDRSPALAADARHLLADVATAVGVAAGVALVIVTGKLWLDPAVAAATAMYVLYSGLHLIRSSAGALMDQALDDATLARIEVVIRQSGGGALEAHDLRTRQAGQSTFLQFHLVVPGTMSVAESHAICDRIEAAFRRDMSHMIVNIHVEPEHKAKHAGGVVTFSN